MLKQGERPMPVGLFVARKVGCRSITGPAPPFQSNWTCAKIGADSLMVE